MEKAVFRTRGLFPRPQESYCGDGAETSPRARGTKRLRAGLQMNSGGPGKPALGCPHVLPSLRKVLHASS